MEIIARRLFSPIYIYFDIAFLVLFLGLLIYKKKYMTVVVGLLAGVLYFLVDYGIFHLLLHTRTISEGHSLFWVLLWMSLSYGFTNFTWILAIGILVQLSWELALLIDNIRSAGMDFENKLQTLCINSLLETNLGIPYIYAIFIAYNSRFTEQLKKRENTLTFMQSLNEINCLSLRNN